MTRGGQGSLKYATVKEQQAAKAAYKFAKERAEKIYQEKLKSDPLLYRQYLDRKAADKRRARQNPKVQKVTNERVSKCHAEVRELRKFIIELDKKFPEILNPEEKYNLKAANRCRSIKYLTALKLKFEEN